VAEGIRRHIKQEPLSKDGGDEGWMIADNAPAAETRGFRVIRHRAEMPEARCVLQARTIGPTRPTPDYPVFSSGGLFP
jgi:hypothetical protein